MSEKNKYVPRVNQIDAIHLNKDITRLMRDNLMNSLQAISPRLFWKIQPEVDLIIQTGIWFGSVGKQCSTFGQQLLVLAYDQDHLTFSRLCLHLVLTVLPNYMKSIEERRFGGNSEWLHKVVEWSENGIGFLSVLNLFRFLKTGCKPTLVDYLLGLDYVSLRYNQRRDIGYKYLTRELLWGGLMEILALLLPIINFRKIHRISKSILRGPWLDSGSRERETKLTNMSSVTVCVYCGERPTLPHHMECGHIYCYYCLVGNVSTDTKFKCTNCTAQLINGFKPVESSK